LEVWRFSSKYCNWKLKPGSFYPHLFNDTSYTAVPIASSLHKYSTFTSQTTPQNRENLLLIFWNRHEVGTNSCLKKTLVSWSSTHNSQKIRGL
jgi:hypothetical protein